MNLEQVRQDIALDCEVVGWGPGSLDSEVGEASLGVHSITGSPPGGSVACVESVAFYEYPAGRIENHEIVVELTAEDAKNVIRRLIKALADNGELGDFTEEEA
jgi:hypothetical protein